jgi:hypothetical protein
MPEPTLELIQTMMQRALDALVLLRQDVSNLRRRVGREAETARRDMADRVSERLETIETCIGIAPKH